MSTGQQLGGEPKSPAVHPSPAGAARRKVPAVAMSEIGIRQQEFRRGFFDQSDPLESAGVQIADFGVSASYPVDREQQEGLVNQLFGCVYGRLQAGSVPDTALQVVDFKDARTGPEPARRFLVAERETVRRTHLRVYATFQTYGDHLYIAVESFMLPPASWLAAGITIGTVGVLALGLIASLGVLGFMLAAAIVVLALRPTLKTLSQGETLQMALRRQFPKVRKLSTFDTDDVLMFFKSVLPLVFVSVQEVFEEKGIPVDVLERAMQTVNNITTINTGGGSFSAAGSAIGGMANRVAGRGK